MTRNRDESGTATETPRRPPRRRANLCVTRVVMALVIGSMLVVSTAAVGSSTSAISPTASGSAQASDQIQYAPASVSITAVGPAGNDTDVERPTTGATIRPNETTVVRGETNLRPDDNAVLVELRTENGTVLAVNATDEWGTDGAWSTILNTSGLAPDTYVLEVEAADSTDRVDVQVTAAENQSTTISEDQSTTTTENQSTTTAENQSTTTQAETNATTTDSEATDPAGENETARTDADAVTDGTTTSGESDASAPGFGSLIAVVAILALGAVASMRRE